jgi:prepilin-type N-terminal cleavage/methylation domain-containing protein
MNRPDKVRGFTLIELMLVLAVLGLISAMAIPAVLNTTRQIKLAANARAVERELQGARMKAVRSNRAIRVRFNCPATGQYRMVELLGSKQTPATDDADSRAATRCGYSAYPFPDTNQDFFSIPNNDGPIQTLQDGIGFGTDAQTVEFWPDGTAHVAAGGTQPWPAITGEGVGITVFDIMHQSTIVTSIGVNGLGKIALH